MKKTGLKSIFITGLLAMLPLVISIYVVKFIYSLITSNLMPPIKKLLGISIAMPDYVWGIVTILIFVSFLFLVGLLTRLYLGKLVFNTIDRLAGAIPLISPVYTAIKQMIESFSSSTNNFQKVVLVEFPRQGMNYIGLVVRDTQSVITDITGEPSYNVFIPTTPNPTSGFIVIVPVKDCRELPLSVEEGIKFIFSAGMIHFKDNNAMFNKKK